MTSAREEALQARIQALELQLSRQNSNPQVSAAAITMAAPFMMGWRVTLLTSDQLIPPAEQVATCHYSV